MARSTQSEKKNTCKSTHLVLFFLLDLNFPAKWSLIFLMPQLNNLSPNISMFYDPLFYTCIPIPFLRFSYSCVFQSPAFQRALKIEKKTVQKRRSRKANKTLFSLQKNLQNCSDSSSHRIFRHMHEALNIDKK
jgi:hypothetical protein